MSKIKALGAGILGLLLAIVVILWQALTGAKRENKRLDAQVKAHERREETEAKINKVTSDAVKEVIKEEKPTKGKGITIFALAFISLHIAGCAAPVACLCPELQIIPRANYTPVTLDYFDHGDGLYCTDYDGATELTNEMRRRNAIIQGYEAQIGIYKSYIDDK